VAEAEAPAETGEEQEKKGAKATRWKLNTFKCTGKSAKDILEIACGDLGWKEVYLPYKAERRTLVYVMQWRDALEVLEAGLGKQCAISRYPGMSDLCDKGVFTRLIDAAPSGPYDWWPETYLWPDQAADIEKMMKKKPAIMKPEDASQGDGIFIATNFRDLKLKLSLRNNGSAIVQRYLTKPLLLRGLKFDLRIYVCVGPGLESPVPLAVCREGLARFCTEPYAAPDPQNLHKVCSHLTNYSLNKLSADFVHGGPEAADENASKRLLSTALQQIAEEHAGFDEAAFWDAVDTMAADVVGLYLPVLRATAAQQKTTAPYFQILGFDVILDSKLKPWLLEVNNNPSLAVDEVHPAPPDEPKPCLCKDLQGPHVHVHCTVDVEAKRAAVCGALERVGAVLTGAASPETAYEEVDVVEDPAVDSVVELWKSAGGSSKAFSSFAVRRVLGPVMGKRLTPADVDIVLQRYKGRVGSRGDEKADLAFLDYLRLLRDLAARVHPDVEDPLPELLSQLSLK